jgi:hypothetical protein
MLETTQEALEKIDPLLDAGDTESAARMLLGLDPTSLRALIIHVLNDRGSAIAERVAKTYLRENAARKPLAPAS